MGHDAIQTLDQPQAGEAPPARKPDIAPEVFHSVRAMEDPIQTADDLLSGILLIAEKLEGDESTVICRLGDLALRALATVEQERGRLFRLSHADRARFEREGWPGEQPAAS